jgi:hypothetical protein
MTQTRLLTSPALRRGKFAPKRGRRGLLGLALCNAAVVLALSAASARSEEIASVYTSLDPKCKDITLADAKDYGTIWRCKGLNGIDVRVAEGDLRIYVSYGPKAEKQTAAQQTVPQFNTIGDKLEWRVAKDGQRGTPFATILRFPWSVDGKTGSTLVVTKLGKDDACHVAYVEAAGNPKANEQARAHADTLARGFDCKRDVPKHHGADGRLTD